MQTINFDLVAGDNHHQQKLHQHQHHQQRQHQQRQQQQQQLHQIERGDNENNSSLDVLHQQVVESNNCKTSHLITPPLSVPTSKTSKASLGTTTPHTSKTNLTTATGFPREGRLGFITTTPKPAPTTTTSERATIVMAPNSSWASVKCHRVRQPLPQERNPFVRGNRDDERDDAAFFAMDDRNKNSNNGQNNFGWHPHGKFAVISRKDFDSHLSTMAPLFITNYSSRSAGPASSSTGDVGDWYPDTNASMDWHSTSVTAANSSAADREIYFQQQPGCMINSTRRSAFRTIVVDDTYIHPRHHHISNNHVQKRSTSERSCIIPQTGSRGVVDAAAATMTSFAVSTSPSRRSSNDNTYGPTSIAPSSSSSWRTASSSMPMQGYDRQRRAVTGAQTMNNDNTCQQLQFPNIQHRNILFGPLASASSVSTTSSSRSNGRERGRGSRMLPQHPNHYHRPDTTIQAPQHDNTNMIENSSSSTIVSSYHTPPTIAAAAPATTTTTTTTTTTAMGAVISKRGEKRQKSEACTTTSMPNSLSPSSASSISSTSSPPPSLISSNLTTTKVQRQQRHEKQKQEEEENEQQQQQQQDIITATTALEQSPIDESSAKRFKLSSTAANAASIIATTMAMNVGVTTSTSTAPTNTDPLTGPFDKLDLLCSTTLDMGPLQDNPSGCSCPKSRCIALYCDCFKAGRRCDPTTCSCLNCKNTIAESGIDGARTRAIRTILARNPRAFTTAGMSNVNVLKQQLPPGEIACNCIRSRCLKLYCGCFQAGRVCNSEVCTCIKCLNTKEDVNGERHLAIQNCLEKRPHAFKMKKDKEIGLGCACKNNRCIRKYCECFRTNLTCSDKCSCRDCGNKGKKVEKNINTAKKDKSNDKKKDDDANTKDDTASVNKESKNG